MKTWLPLLRESDARLFVNVETCRFIPKDLLLLCRYFLGGRPRRRRFIRGDPHLPEGGRRVRTLPGSHGEAGVLDLLSATDEVFLPASWTL
jgi:hypothetical protein